MADIELLICANGGQQGTTHSFSVIRHKFIVGVSKVDVDVVIFDALLLGGKSLKVPFTK